MSNPNQSNNNKPPSNFQDLNQNPQNFLKYPQPPPNFNPYVNQSQTFQNFQNFGNFQNLNQPPPNFNHGSLLQHQQNPCIQTQLSLNLPNHPNNQGNYIFLDESSQHFKQPQSDPQPQQQSQPQQHYQKQLQPQSQLDEANNDDGDIRLDAQSQPRPQLYSKSHSSWDDPSDPRPLLPWLPIKKTFDPSKERNPKMGVLATIGKTFKRSLDPHGTTWSKISDDVKEFYWNEFKKFYKWDPRIDAYVKRAWNIRCSQRYRDRMNKLRSKYQQFKELQEKERQERKAQEEDQGEQEEPQEVEFNPNMPSNVWGSWKNAFESQDFKTLSDRAKVNRRRGMPNARPLPTYRGGGLSAARLGELMAQEAENVDLTSHSMLVRTKGVRGKGGEHMLTLDIDKQIDKMYNDLNDEDIKKGDTPNLNKNYLKAVKLVVKTKKTPHNVYGIGSADDQFFPELSTSSTFRSPQIDLRRELDELHSVANELRTYVSVQSAENNPSARDLREMQNQLSSMHESIKRLESQFAGESSHAGASSGSGAHDGSLSASCSSYDSS